DDNRRTGHTINYRETDVNVLVDDGIEYLNDPYRVSVTFFTKAVPPPEAREHRVPVAMSAINPGAVALLALCALAAGLLAMRKRLPLPGRSEARAEAPAWKDE